MFSQVGNLLAPHYDVIDKKTGQRIPLVQWADEKSGFYEILLQNEDGTWKEHYDIINEEWILDKKTIRGDIELVGKNIFFRLLKKVIDKFTK